MEEPLDDDHDREARPLDAQEAENVRADIEDLDGMRRTFQGHGVKGVAMPCEHCQSNHFYEWELIQENLEHMLQTGESYTHEPAFDVREDEYILWDYGKGYIHALADTGLEPDHRVEVTRCPWCRTPAEDHFQFCPRCGRSFAALRIYRELVDRGLDERDVRAMLVRAGFEPFSP